MKLSPREQQVLALLSTGKGYNDISKHLGISLNTVRTRVRFLYPKLKAHSAAEAVRNYEIIRKEEMQMATKAEEIENKLSVAMGVWLEPGSRKKRTNLEYVMALKAAVATVIADMLPENYTNPKGENEDSDEQRETEKRATVRGSKEPLRGDDAESEQQGEGSETSKNTPENIPRGF